MSKSSDTIIWGQSKKAYSRLAAVKRRKSSLTYSDRWSESMITLPRKRRSVDLSITFALSRPWVGPVQAAAKLNARTHASSTQTGPSGQ